MGYMALSTMLTVFSIKSLPFDQLEIAENGSRQNMENQYEADQVGLALAAFELKIDNYDQCLDESTRVSDLMTFVKHNFRYWRFRDWAPTSIIYNRSDAQGKRSLHYVAGLGNPQLIDLLVDRGATYVNSIDKSGSSPLMIAIKSGNAEVVDRLLNIDEIDINRFYKNGKTLLHQAAELGSVEVIKLLLKRGATGINIIDTNGMAPLHYAAHLGHVGVIQLLLESGATGINIGDINGITPLHYAAGAGDRKRGISAGSGSFEVVKLLLATKQVNINTVINTLDAFRRTPLHCAAESGNLEVVKFLLDNGATGINNFDDYHMTPLHYAVGQRYQCAGLRNAVPLGNTEVVELLLDQSTKDLNASGYKDMTPLVSAVKSKNIEMVLLLIARGATVINKKKEINVELFKYLIDEGRLADVMRLKPDLKSEKIGVIIQDLRFPVLRAFKKMISVIDHERKSLALAYILAGRTYQSPEGKPTDATGVMGSLVSMISGFLVGPFEPVIGSIRMKNAQSVSGVVFGKPIQGPVTQADSNAYKSSLGRIGTPISYGTSIDRSGTHVILKEQLPQDETHRDRDDSLEETRLTQTEIARAARLKK